MSQRRQVMEAASEFGGTAVMQYWNDVVNVSLALTERQAALWSGIWQQAVSGATTPEFAREDLRRVWAEYLHGLSTWVTFPVQWWLRWVGDVPTVVFILDLNASTSLVQSLAAPVSVTASVRNWRMMSRERAPTAFRTPISRVRSVTLTSMMFMTPIPPTSSPSPDREMETSNTARLMESNCLMI